MATHDRQPLSARLLAPIVTVRAGESTTALMMFAYSFLAMTAYNIVQPIVRSRFITALGADNLPYVLLVSVFIIGALMHGYSKLGGLMPPRWVIPATQLGIVVLLVVFWQLSATGSQWVEVAFYLFGQIYGILLISQFWTLANLIYDARGAKRLFGFIGAGSSLGGILGGAITTLATQRFGNRNLMLVSAGALALCAAVVVAIVRRARDVEFSAVKEAGKEKGVGGFEALRMLRESKHLQVISIVIALTSIGAGLIDQQLNMATEFFKGRGATDSMTVVLAQVQVYTSTIGFVIQVWLTSRIHRLLGVGFALLILPVGLGLTGATILLNAALWAPVFARVLDKSLRYTVDKTSREVLFLPLPADLKQKAKPFIDVTVDRVGRAASAFLLLVLIKPWGLGLTGARWNQISWASLAVMTLWIAMAVRAKRGYVEAFRRSLANRDVAPGDIRLPSADLSTIETLVDELGHPDERRVVYAIDLLEALDRQRLITPLLLHHESRQVRIRVLEAVRGMDAERAARFDRLIEALLKDPDVEVRAAAVRALAAVRDQSARALMCEYLEDPDVRVRLSAAAALADSADPADFALAERTLEAVARDEAPAARAEVAAVLERVRQPRLHHVLIGLFFDEDADVARRAIAAARASAGEDPLFAPPLVSLLRHRALKPDARDALVAIGAPVIDVMGHVLADVDEDITVRREIPGVLARIPDPRSMERLVAALADADGGVRFAALAACERLHRRDDLDAPHLPIETLLLKESSTYFAYLGLRYNIFEADTGDRASLLARALDEKLQRTLDRIYRALGLLFPWRDIEAVRWAMTQGDARGRASAIEYLDNLLAGALRKRVLPVIDEMPLAEKVRKGNVFIRSRVRSTDESLAQLVHDEDQVLSAAAIQYVEQQGRWSLADDLEYVLQHRDARDWYVFEAASWTLAGRRLEHARRRTLWLEPLPAIELADRLRPLPLFAFVPVDELARLGAAGQQQRHEPGRVIAADAPSRPLLFLLDGAIAIEEAGGPRRVEAPAAIGLLEALHGEPVLASMRAADICATLELRYDALVALLADSPSLVRGLFRVALADDDPAPPILRARSYDEDRVAARAPGPRTAIDLVLALQRIAMFSGAPTADLLALAGHARTIDVQPGTTLTADTEPAAVIIPLTTPVNVERADGSGATSAAVGDAVGVHATLAGAASGWRVYATAATTVLRIEGADLFQVLGERVSLFQRVFASIAREPVGDAPVPIVRGAGL